MVVKVDSGRTTGSSGRMMFIVSSNVDKVDPDTRKLIRSHVMRGKKQKKSCPGRAKREISQANMTHHTPTAPVSLEQVMKTHALLVPRTIGSDWSFAEFTDEREPLMALNMENVSTIAMRIMFPLMVAIGFQEEHKESCSPVPLDLAALHIAAFAVYGFIDRILRRQEKLVNPAAMLHFQKGVKLLRERLVGPDDDIKLSDSTIGVVLKLASHAHFEGDYQTSKQHMEGLRKMVDLRGGLNVFKGNAHLVEMLRCDLSIALHNGSKPVFFRQPSEPVPEYPEKLIGAPGNEVYSEDNIEFLRAMDPDLATAWGAMRRFCLLVNLGTQIRRLIYRDIILETMTAVFYRLLDMDFSDGSVDEIVRLGLLAFCHHLFLQWQDIRLPYHRFPANYRNCLLEIKQSTKGISDQVMLWLLMTGAISLYNISDEAWLREYLREYADRCQVKTWKKMQEKLKSVMWVVLLDEQPGKQIFNLLYLDKEKKQ